MLQSKKFNFMFSLSMKLRCRELNYGLFENNLTDNKYCVCGEVDAPFHYLFQCQQYTLFHYQWGSNRTNNIDGAEPVRVSHNAILVSRMHLATMALLCKQTTDNSRTSYPPEPRWRHLSGNRVLFVPHCIMKLISYKRFNWT